MHGCGYSYLVPRKCVIVGFPHGVDRQNSGIYIWSRGWAVSPKYSVPDMKTFLRCLG